MNSSSTHLTHNQYIQLNKNRFKWLKRKCVNKSLSFDCVNFGVYERVALLKDVKS